MNRQPCTSNRLVIAGVFALLVSCGGSSGDPSGDGGAADGSGDDPIDAAATPDAGPVAAGALCDELTTMLCEAEQACCGDPGSRYASVEECFAAENQACLDAIQATASDSQTGYDPAIAREELDDLGALLAACDPSMGQWFVSHDGLLRIYQGTVGQGGDCTPSGVDDPGPVLSCLEPLVCQLTPLPLGGTCGAMRTNGDSCVTEVECADGLRCTPPESLDGQCAPRLSDGSGCDVDGDCASLLCRDGNCATATTDLVYCFAAE